MGVRLVRYNNGLVVQNNLKGTSDHNELLNRDLVNQHPINAITGLQETIDEIKKKLHAHENFNVLKEFSELNSVLLYKGSPIIGTSTHEKDLINTEKGIHGIRYYDNKLQYFFNKQWNNISTGGTTNIITDKDIVLSSAPNNALVKYSNGYFVQSFLISQKTNNALIKYSDGYYVPKIPANNATTDDIDEAKDEINDELIKQNRVFNERYDVITQKMLQIAGNTTKFQTYKYSGNNTKLSSVIDISTLYSLSSDVILNLEFMIKNNSESDILNIKILENDIETLNDILTKSEVQRYKLPNIPNIEIFIKGDYQLFLYVNYV